jgi:hypothetical protein
LTKKFWLEVLRDFLLGVAVVVITDASALIDAGSKEQLAVVAAALGRQALKAGIAAIAPKILGLRKGSDAQA